MIAAAFQAALLLAAAPAAADACAEWRVSGLRLGMTPAEARAAAPGLEGPGWLVRQTLPDGARLLESDRVWAWFEDGALVSATMQIDRAAHDGMRRALADRLGSPADDLDGAPWPADELRIDDWAVDANATWSSAECDAALRLTRYAPDGLPPVVQVVLEDLSRLRP